MVSGSRKIYPGSQMIERPGTYSIPVNLKAEMALEMEPGPKPPPPPPWKWNLVHFHGGGWAKKKSVHDFEIPDQPRVYVVWNLFYFPSNYSIHLVLGKHIVHCLDTLISCLSVSVYHFVHAP